MDWKFFAGLIIPAIGATFVWMTGIARKDPPLWELLSSTLKWRLPVWGGSILGATLVAVIGRGWEESADTVFLVVVLILGIVQVLLALPFFDKIAKLPVPPKE